MVVSAAFEKAGDGTPTQGTLSLYVNDDKVGEGKIMTQPGNFSLVGEGLNVGKDPGTPQDVLLQEPRIESFFPFDDATRRHAEELTRHQPHVG